MRELLNVIVFVIVCFGNAKAQTISNELHYVKVIIDNLETPQQAFNIREIFLSKSGVVAARGSWQTGLFMVKFYTSTGYSKTDVALWIESLGITPACMVEGPIGNGEKTIRLTKEDCLSGPDLILEK